MRGSENGEKGAALNRSELVGKQHVFHTGDVVVPAPDLVAVQTTEGQLVPCDKLGPGVVELVDAEGTVRVRWAQAESAATMDPADLRSPGDHAHLLTVVRVDKRGNRKLVRHKVDVSAGLESNWTVELRPGNIVRALRSDGAAWSFSWNYLWERIEVQWPQPPEDADAEALAAAELAMTTRV